MTDNAKLKILIVDDDISLGMLLSNTLRGEGLDPHTANNGKVGIEKAKQLQPDVIFMDINMPQMNGFETCEAMKQDDELKSIPIIFMTSMGDDNDRLKGFSCGAEDYIVKPVNYKEILARLKRFISASHSQEVLSSINAAAETCKSLISQISGNEDVSQKLSIEIESILSFVKSHNA